MLKRLIEVALPLKEVSEQSAREKSIRHGHISTLRIWWARRPLAACRAAVFASLIPDPDDPECPESFRTLVTEQLARSEFKPTSEASGKPVEDTPRNRCLEFIKHLVRWENSNNSAYIDPARSLIAAAHKLLHPNAQGPVPKVLDPFAGGGAIPLEALRLSCEADAVDLNPVAHLIQLCTLVYPQKYGRPDSRPVPDYIKRLIAHNKAKKGKHGAGLFDGKEEAEAPTCDDLIPNIEISEAEYRKNPLAADVKYWGHWVPEQARREIGQFYPADSDGSVPVAYLWARTVKSPSPSIQAEIPLIRQPRLCKQAKRNVALKMTPSPTTGRCCFTIVENKAITFDPDEGTIRRGNAICPFSGAVASVNYLRNECRAGRMSQQLMAVVLVRQGQQGKIYRAATDRDLTVFKRASEALAHLKQRFGDDVIPQEPISKRQPRLMWITTYGVDKWSWLFNDRQLLALVTLSRSVQATGELLKAVHDADYAKAIATYLGVAVSRFSDFNSSLCTFNFTGGRGVKNSFARQALPMVWDYAESAAFNPQGANWQACVEAAVETIARISVPTAAQVYRGSATATPIEAGSVAAVIMDPPYYDAVPYADLSDFFYVWMKRALGKHYPDVLRTPLTPKRQELIEERPHSSLKDRKDGFFYEAGMVQVFKEMCRTLPSGGVCCVMFAHKTTTAWEALIGGLQQAGLSVSASWPFHTERPGRMMAQSVAALAGSVTLVCRKRPQDAGDGHWDDVRKELQPVAKERLDFFWSQGIRGADFFISAIGPALSAFCKYERVTKLSGEEVTVGQFLDEVRGVVTNYALAKILKTTQTGIIDPKSRFYVVWKWSYGEVKVPADESFKLAQALGMDTEIMWDRTGVLEKSSQNVQALSVAKRMKIKGLGEPDANSAPASLVDVLHRMCVFREKGDTEGMAEFLSRTGQAQNPALWLVAQAISEILPDGDKEKQLMQGLLNQREQLAEAQGRLF